MVLRWFCSKDWHQICKNKKDTQQDIVTTSTHNNINTIESIIQDEENDMQGGFDICKYDSKTLQQNPLLELYEIHNVILKENQKKFMHFVNYKRVCRSWQLLLRTTVIMCAMAKWRHLSTTWKNINSFKGHIKAVNKNGVIWTISTNCRQCCRWITRHQCKHWYSSINTW